MFGVLAGGTFGVLKGGGFDDPNSDSSQARTLIDSQFGGQTNLVFLATPTDGDLDTSGVVTAATTAVDRLKAEKGVDNVVTYWTEHVPSLASRDRRAGLITAHVSGDEDQAAKTATAVIKNVATEDGPLRIQAGGQLGANDDVTTQIAKDLALAESIAVPLTLLLLLLAFGSAVAALLPLGVGLIAVLGTFAVLDVLGHITSVSTYSINLTTAMGLGLAIDYSLLIVSRFREEVASGRDTETAVVRTLQTAGRTVVFSAATVAVALGAMLVFPLYFLRSFAYAGIGVVLVAMLAAVVSLPALLAVLGPRINAGRLRRRPVGSASEESSFWRRVAGGVMRRPVASAVPVIVLLLLVGIPFLSIAFATPDDRVLPTSHSSRQVGDALRGDFDVSAAAATYAVISGPVASSAIDRFAMQVSQLPDVVSVQYAGGTWTDGARGGQTDAARFTRPGVQYLLINGPADSSSTASQNLVGAVRDVPVPGRRFSRRRPGRAGGLQGGDRRRTAAGRAVDCAEHLHPAVPLHRQRRPADQSADPQRARSLGGLRRDRVDLPAGPPVRCPRLHARTDQHLNARAAVLHRVRSVDGLRGVPAVAGQGAARQRDEQHRRGRGRLGPHRSHRHDRGGIVVGNVPGLRHELGQLPEALRNRHRALAIL